MNAEQLKKQKLWKYSIIGLVGTLFLGFSGNVIFDYVNSMNSPNKTYTSTAQLPLDGVDPKEIWVDQIRTENEVVQEKVDFIQEMFLKRVQEEGERETSTQSEIVGMRKEIDNLRADLKKSQIPSTAENLRDELRNVSVNHREDNWDPFVNPLMTAPPILEVFTPLASAVCPEAENLHHVNRSIPAGTSVKAILMSSVDMPCGVRGSTDPLPVKLRIIANGRLPHEVRARLKSGIVTACVYGDLSSERVYFRLEKLTQIRSDGHYIETQIAGYVSGEDGKYGLRGVVVDKSAQLVENALMSGFLSGASNFFQAAAVARLSPLTSINGCSPEGCQQPSWGQTAGQLAVAGGAGGVTNALDALTDYFIKRAEQLRPVIQVTPGRIVDITFSDRADLGDLYTHERVRNSGQREISCGT